MQSNHQTSIHGLMWKYSYNEPRMNASATHTEAAGSHAKGGKNRSVGFQSRARALDLGNAGGDRASPSPTHPPDPCAIPRSQSPPCLSSRDRNHEITGTDTLLGACPAGAEHLQWGEAQSAPFVSLELTARAPLRKNAAHNDILIHNMLVQTMLVQLLYESSSTSSTSTSSEEDRRSIEPSLRGEETGGGLPIPESGLWIWWKRMKIGARLSPFPPPDPFAIPTSAAAKAGPALRGTLLKAPSSKRAFRGRSAHNACFAPKQTMHRLCVSPLVM